MVASLFQTANQGANGLPRIIGGADLVVYREPQNEAREAWFREMEEVNFYGIFYKKEK